MSDTSDVDVFVSEDGEELDKRLQKDHPERIRNLTRLSVDAPKILLKNLKPYNADVQLAKADSKVNIFIMVYWDKTCCDI